MAFEKFNSVGGYSVGIPPIDVIDENGNLISNVTTFGSVTANAFYLSNGVPITAQLAGSNTQIQFNNSGNFGASPNLTFNTVTSLLTTINFTANGNVTLGDASTLKVFGGLNGYFLQTDGTGNLSWAAGGGGGGNGNPGGANTQIQFNDSGMFGGDSGFTYNKNTDTVSIININTTGLANLGNVSNVKIYGGANGYLLKTDGNGNIYWSTNGGSNGTPGGSNTQVQFNDDDAFAGDSTFTFDKDTGILTVPYLNTGDISADVIGANALQVLGNIDTANINVTTRANISGNLRAVGNITFSSSPNVFLGTLANIHITGGVNGYVLTTDGLGNLSWQAGGGGGNGTPGGSNTQVQFNNNGVFAGDPYFTYDNFNKIVQVGGNLIANSLQMGAGVYKWSTSQVYFATTASTSPAQVLYSIGVADLSGVDFEIFGTEPAGPSRQSCKISALYYNGVVEFNEYASLFVNGGVGNFEVDYDAGNIIVPASLKLKVTPNSNNPITYKMLITVYAG